MRVLPLCVESSLLPSHAPSCTAPLPLPLPLTRPVAPQIASSLASCLVPLAHCQAPLVRALPLCVKSSLLPSCTPSPAAPLPLLQEGVGPLASSLAPPLMPLAPPLAQAIPLAQHPLPLQEPLATVVVPPFAPPLLVRGWPKKPEYAFVDSHCLVR